MHCVEGRSRLIDEEFFAPFFKEIEGLPWTGEWSISIFLDPTNGDWNPVGICFDKTILDKIKNVDIDIYNMDDSCIN